MLPFNCTYNYGYLWSLVFFTCLYGQLAHFVHFRLFFFRLGCGCVFLYVGVVWGVLFMCHCKKIIICDSTPTNLNIFLLYYFTEVFSFNFSIPFTFLSSPFIIIILRWGVCVWWGWGLQTVILIKFLELNLYPKLCIQLCRRKLIQSEGH